MQVVEASCISRMFFLPQKLDPTRGSLFRDIKLSKDVSRRWDVDAVVDTTHLLANQLPTRCIYYKERFNGNKTGVHQKDFGDAPGIYKTYTRHCRSLKNNSACVPLLTRDDKWTDSNLSKVETLPKTQQISHNVATTPRTGPRSKTRLSAVAVHVQTYSVMNARIWHTVTYGFKLVDHAGVRTRRIPTQHTELWQKCVI